MNENFRSSFLRLAECHANAVAGVKAFRQSDLENGRVDHSGLLSQAVAREEEARAALIDCKPNSKIEAQSKFLYVVQYLISMRTSLDNQEMAAMINSVAHLLNQERA